MKIIIVAGARPNFMKIAPIIKAIDKHNESKISSASAINYTLVHTGQHYDYEMSKVFFENLDIPKPDVYLGVGSGNHGEQTGKVMIEFEKLITGDIPDAVMVVGDVNSTVACALTAVKLHIPIAHVEAGLRSLDRTMPEEINRIVTDVLSDYLFTTCEAGNNNLRREGIPEEKIFLVGDVMIDTLLAYREKASKTDILRKLKLVSDNKEKIIDYCLLTLHRPSNVDDKNSFLKILKALQKVSEQIPLIFPVHPRTKKQIETFNTEEFFKNTPYNAWYPLPPKIYSIDPLSYLDFLNLMMHAKFVLTDSGSIQEETTVLNVPCLTLRDTTERPDTITEGTNILVWNNTQNIIEETSNIMRGQGKKGKVFKQSDGKASERIVEILARKFKSKKKRRLLEG